MRQLRAVRRPSTVHSFRRPRAIVRTATGWRITTGPAKRIVRPMRPILPNIRRTSRRCKTRPRPSRQRRRRRVLLKRRRSAISNGDKLLATAEWPALVPALAFFLARSSVLRRSYPKHSISRAGSGCARKGSMAPTEICFCYNFLQPSRASTDFRAGRFEKFELGKFRAGQAREGVF